MNKPLAALLLSLLLGFGMAACGVFLLIGLGWSLIVGSLPFIGFGLVVARGMKRAE